MGSHRVRFTCGATLIAFPSITDIYIHTYKPFWDYDPMQQDSLPRFLLGNYIHFELPLLTVSGDANFDMDRTALTVGGFTQPIVAKSLIELPASVEKGLTQRFLWLSPKPSFAKFETLEMVHEGFCTYLGELR